VSDGAGIRMMGLTDWGLGTGGLGMGRAIVGFLGLPGWPVKCLLGERKYSFCK
jgi:hypothetical protein